VIVWSTAHTITIIGPTYRGVKARKLASKNKGRVSAAAIAKTTLLTQWWRDLETCADVDAG